MKRLYRIETRDAFCDQWTPLTQYTTRRDCLKIMAARWQCWPPFARITSKRLLPGEACR